MLRAGLVAGLQGGVDVDLFQPLSGLHDRTQVHVRVSVLRCPDNALRAAGAREPDVGPWLLHGQHPRVYHAILIVLSFVAERARLGPALDDQVVGFLETLPVLGGFDSGLKSLDCATADEPGYDPPSGITVEHGHFFGHPDGVVYCDHVTENGDLDVLGELSENGSVQVDRRFSTPIRRVVLVGHDAVEPNLVG